VRQTGVPVRPIFSSLKTRRAQDLENAGGMPGGMGGTSPERTHFVTLEIKKNRQKSSLPAFLVGQGCYANVVLFSVPDAVRSSVSL